MNDDGLIDYFKINGITSMDIVDILNDSPFVSPKKIQKAQKLYLKWCRLQKLKELF